MRAIVTREFTANRRRRRTPSSDPRSLRLLERLGFRFASLRTRHSWASGPTSY